MVPPATPRPSRIVVGGGKGAARKGSISLLDRERPKSPPKGAILYIHDAHHRGPFLLYPAPGLPGPINGASPDRARGRRRGEGSEDVKALPGPWESAQRERQCEVLAVRPLPVENGYRFLCEEVERSMRRMKACRRGCHFLEGHVWTPEEARGLKDGVPPLRLPRAPSVPDALATPRTTRILPGPGSMIGGSLSDRLHSGEAELQSPRRTISRGCISARPDLISRNGPDLASRNGGAAPSSGSGKSLLPPLEGGGPSKQQESLDTPLSPPHTQQKTAMAKSNPEAPTPGPSSLAQRLRPLMQGVGWAVHATVKLPQLTKVPAVSRSQTLASTHAEKGGRGQVRATEGMLRELEAADAAERAVEMAMAEGKEARGLHGGVLGDGWNAGPGTYWREFQAAAKKAEVQAAQEDFRNLKRRLNWGLRGVLQSLENLRPYSFRVKFSSLETRTGVLEADKWRLNADRHRLERFLRAIERQRWYPRLIKAAFLGGRLPTHTETLILDHVRKVLEVGQVYTDAHLSELILQLAKLGTSPTVSHLEHPAVRHALAIMQNALGFPDQEVRRLLLSNGLPVPLWVPKPRVPTGRLSLVTSSPPMSPKQDPANWTEPCPDSPTSARGGGVEFSDKNSLLVGSSSQGRAGSIPSSPVQFAKPSVSF